MNPYRLTVAILTLVTGCATLNPPPVEPAADCALPTTSAGSPGEQVVTIGMTQGESEFLSQDLFRQVFQTLTKTDCRGRVVPDFALGWERMESGGIRFEIPHAKFDDGTKVDAAGLVAAWAGPSGHPLGVDSIRANGSSHIEVFGAAAVDMASPAFAIWNGNREVPASTGPFRITRRSASGAPLELTDGRTTLRTLSAGNARDLLTQVHILRTWDTDVLDLAVQLPGVTTHAVNWTRSYGLLVPSGSGIAALPELLQTQLSQQVVPANARATVCEAGNTLAAGPAPTAESRLIYADPRDPVSLALAERIAAISTRSGPESRALQSVSGLGNLTLVRSESPPTDGVRIAVSLQPCLASESGLWVPLIEVQTRLIVDQLTVGAFIDGNGFLVIAPRPDQVPQPKGSR